jgi:peroxiredoxin
MKTINNLMGKLRKHHWTLLSVVILLITGAWIWMSRLTPDDITSSSIAIPKEGFQAPNFTLETSNGETIILSDLLGKPIVINFWASWCPPCRAEMPALQSTFEENQELDLIILAVNTTNQDSIEKAVSFAEEFELTFPILFDRDGSVSRLYQTSALPTTYFINREGIIEKVIIGGPMSEALLESVVEGLLQGN